MSPPAVLSSLAPAALESAVASAAADLAATLANLGKTELAGAVPILTQFAADAAQWEIARVQAQASGNAAALDQYNRDFGILAADAAAAVADAGVLAQSASESELQTVVGMLGKAVLTAAIAAI